MSEHGLPLLIHGESVDSNIDIFDRELDFIVNYLTSIIERHPRLKIVLEHISTADAVRFVESCSENVVATITAHHLLFNRTHIFCHGKLHPHLYCLPILKKESHRIALLNAATSGNPKFFLGTDSAPHSIERKQSDCGCAGIFSSPISVELYAEAFDSVGRLDRLEEFCSVFGQRFYGLPLTEKKISLTRKSSIVPEFFPFGDGSVRCLRAGEEILWSRE